MSTPLLDIQDLCVDFPTGGGVLHAVDGLSLTVHEGEVLGLVGESGSGKSVSMLAALGLVDAPGQVRARRLCVAGQDLLALKPRERQRVLGRDVAMIFQDPTTSLNPCLSIGFQLVETLRWHLAMDRKTAWRRAIELLDQVGIPSPDRRMNDYPHQLSGGMNQRVMIAMAIACNPRLLIADEPTTALDVTIQAQILDLLRQLQRERGMALVMITHNMGVVAEIAQRVAVMYAGQLVEERSARVLFEQPAHPYTRALLAAMPERSSEGARLATIAGVVPGAFDRPGGCLFQPRCQQAREACQQAASLSACDQGQVRCHFPVLESAMETSA